MDSLVSSSSSHPPVRPSERSRISTPQPGQLFMSQLIERTELPEILKRLCLTPDQVVRIAYYPQLDAVALTYLSTFPAASSFEYDFPLPSAIPLLSMTYIGRSMALFGTAEASTGHDGDLARIVGIFARHFVSLGFARFQLVLAGVSLGSERRQYLCNIETNDLQILGKVKDWGVLSLRYVPLSDRLLGLRMYERSPQPVLSCFVQRDLQREPGQLFKPENWLQIKPLSDEVINVVALSGAKTDGEDVSFVAQMSDGSNRVVSIQRSSHGLVARWDRPIVLPYGIVRPILGQPGTGLCATRPDPTKKDAPHGAVVIARHDLIPGPGTNSGSEFRRLHDFFS